MSNKKLPKTRDATWPPDLSPDSASRDPHARLRTFALALQSVRHASGPRKHARRDMLPMPTENEHRSKKELRYLSMHGPVPLQRKSCSTTRVSQTRAWAVHVLQRGVCTVNVSHTNSARCPELFDSSKGCFCISSGSSQGHEKRLNPGTCSF